MMSTQSVSERTGSGDLQVTVSTKRDTEPLDVAYALTPYQAAFFKREIGIDDDDDLRAHILGVQEKAYKIRAFTCIKSLTFLQLGISRQPEYERIIRLGRERPEGILLDIGCCFGVDARKAVADGFPLQNVVTSDLIKEFYDMGHALFRTSPVTYPISFVAGDALDPNTLQIVPPFDTPPLTERPDLASLTSLNPIAGRCSVIYASNFFHVFHEANQRQLARALAGLLSPLPGSMICGEHAGSSEKGTFLHEGQGWKFDMFHHSPESWTALWDGDVFVKGTVRVNVKLEWVEVLAAPAYHRLLWSVVRL